MEFAIPHYILLHLITVQLPISLFISNAFSFLFRLLTFWGWIMIPQIWIFCILKVWYHQMDLLVWTSRFPSLHLMIILIRWISMTLCLGWYHLVNLHCSRSACILFCPLSRHYKTYWGQNKLNNHFAIELYCKKNLKMTAPLANWIFDFSSFAKVNPIIISLDLQLKYICLVKVWWFILFSTFLICLAH